MKKSELRKIIKEEAKKLMKEGPSYSDYRKAGDILFGIFEDCKDGKEAADAVIQCLEMSDAEEAGINWDEMVKEIKKKL